VRGTYMTQREPAFVRRPFLGFPPGILLLAGLVTLASSHFFPFFPLFWALPVFVMPTLRRALMQRESVPVLVKPTLPQSKDRQEKELLEALARRGQITAANAALETSLSVAQAEEMLAELAAEGHLEVGIHGVTLTYALWERSRHQALSEESPNPAEQSTDQGSAEGDSRG
jgi:hypothetical protein